MNKKIYQAIEYTGETLNAVLALAAEGIEGLRRNGCQIEDTDIYYNVAGDAAFKVYFTDAGLQNAVEFYTELFDEATAIGQLAKDYAIELQVLNNLPAASREYLRAARAKLALVLAQKTAGANFEYVCETCDCRLQGCPHYRLEHLPDAATRKHTNDIIDLVEDYPAVFGATTTDAEKLETALDYLKKLVSEAAEPEIFEMADAMPPAQPVSKVIRVDFIDGEYLHEAYNTPVSSVRVLYDKIAIDTDEINLTGAEKDRRVIDTIKRYAPRLVVQAANELLGEPVAAPPPAPVGKPQPVCAACLGTGKLFMRVQVAGEPAPDCPHCKPAPAAAPLPAEDARRQELIGDIEGLFPGDSEWADTRTVAIDLIFSAIAENWRCLPLPVLETYASLCRRRDRA